MSKDEKCPKCGQEQIRGVPHREGTLCCLQRQLTQLRADKERLQAATDMEVARAYEHCREIAANRIDEGAGDGWAAACTIIAATICVQKREHFRQAAEAAEAGDLTITKVCPTSDLGKPEQDHLFEKDTAKPQGQGEKSDGKE